MGMGMGMGMGMHVTMRIMPIMIMPTSVLHMVVVLARVLIVGMGLRGPLA